MAGKTASIDVGQSRRLRTTLSAYWRHSGWAPDPVGKCFDDAAFDRIEAAIEQGETTHRAEIQVAVESTLSWHALRKGISLRERALQVFGKQQVWDTEENTGILIYLLTTERAVEIIADRRVNQLVPATIWQDACQLIASAGAQQHPVEGLIEAIELLNRTLAEVLPAQPGQHNPNELANRPSRL